MEDAGVCPASSLGQQLSAGGGFRCEQKAWETLDFEKIRSSSCGLVFSVTSPMSAGAAFLHWLRTNPVRVPTLAVLWGDCGEDLIRTASQVADDFALSPVSLFELHERLERFLGPPQG